MTQDDILDDLFHGCAFRAFLEVANAQGRWPDSETTKHLAYAYYEAALAERNGRS